VLRDKVLGDQKVEMRLKCVWKHQKLFVVDPALVLVDMPPYEE
jgi:hypothetical protein